MSAKTGKMVALAVVMMVGEMMRSRLNLEPRGPSPYLPQQKNHCTSLLSLSFFSLLPSLSAKKKGTEGERNKHNFFARKEGKGVGQRRQRQKPKKIESF